jgi:hypothetical protein
MTQVEELQVRIRSLPIEDFSKLRDWFLELEDEIWDQKIRDDFKAGKFNKLRSCFGKKILSLQALGDGQFDHSDANYIL